jgi:hypothetical protein
MAHRSGRGRSLVGTGSKVSEARSKAIRAAREQFGETAKTNNIIDWICEQQSWQGVKLMCRRYGLDVVID